MVEPNGGCVILLIVCVIYYLFKEMSKGLDKWASGYHVCPRAFQAGWPEPYCQAMIDRGMRFYLGEWIPYYDVDDRNSEELKAKLYKKDIALDEDGDWVLIGKTLEEVNRKIDRNMK